MPPTSCCCPKKFDIEAKQEEFSLKSILDGTDACGKINEFSSSCVVDEATATLNCTSEDGAAFTLANTDTDVKDKQKDEHFNFDFKSFDKTGAQLGDCGVSMAAPVPEGGDRGIESQEMEDSISNATAIGEEDWTDKISNFFKGEQSSTSSLSSHIGVVLALLIVVV